MNPVAKVEAVLSLMRATWMLRQAKRVVPGERCVPQVNGRFQAVEKILRTSGIGRTATDGGNLAAHSRTTVAMRPKAAGLEFF